MKRSDIGDGKSEEEYRKMGNSFFKKKRFLEAIRCYQAGLRVCEENQKHILHSNSAAAYLQLRKFDLALEESKKCVENNPSFEKGYVRLIRSYIAKGEFEISKCLTFSHITNEKMKNALLSSIEIVCPTTFYHMSIISPNFSPKVRFRRPVGSMDIISDRKFHEDTVFKSFQFKMFVYDDHIFQLGGGCLGGFSSNALLKLEGRYWREIRTKNSEIVPLFHYQKRKVIFSEENDCVFLWDGLNFLNKHSIARLDMKSKVWSLLPQIDWIKCYEMNSGSLMGLVGNTLYLICIYNDSFDAYDLFDGQEESSDDNFGKIYGYDIRTRTTKNENPQHPWKVTKVKDCSKNMVSLLRDLKGSLFKKVKGQDLAILFWTPDGLQPIVINLVTGNTSLIDLSAPTYFLEKLRYRVVEEDRMYCVYADNPSKRFIPILFCEYNPFSCGNKNCEDGKTLLCLYNERYLLQMDYENLKWVELAKLSNTRIIDDLLEERLKKGKEEFSHQVHTMGTILGAFGVGEKRKFFFHATKGQFHSMVVWKNFLYCFLDSRIAPFEDIKSSVVVTRIDSQSGKNTKENLHSICLKKREFCDVQIICML